MYCMYVCSGQYNMYCMYWTVCTGWCIVESVVHIHYQRYLLSGLVYVHEVYTGTE